ncbi:MAG: AI-2E family transporter [Proteobacteria bacterium]|nr:AI-2E family transporter [Pseudomonadota bacterium]MCL2308115.1 AI-2E family transporter [Pseudomonadota bacterium]
MSDPHLPSPPPSPPSPPLLTTQPPPAPVPPVAPAPAAPTPPAPPQRPASPALPVVPLSWRHYVWVIGAVVVFVLLLQGLGPILTPFFAGAILAYLGSPLVEGLSKKGVSRTLGTLAVIVLLLAAISVLLLVLIPLIRSEASVIAKRVPELFDHFTTTLLPTIESWLGITLSLDMNALRTLLADNLDSAQAVSLHVLTGVKSGGQLLLSIIINIVLIPVVMFYLLRDWNILLRGIDDLVPRRWHGKTTEIAGQIDAVLAEFVRGQCLVMLALCVYYVTALWAVGLEFALPIGLLTGLLVFIPYVGYGIGLTLAVVAALLQWSGWPPFLAVLAVYGVGQLLESYVLTPRLVGDRIGLHPLTIIFVLLAFGQLFGFVGVLLALPMSAAMLVALRHLRAAYKQSPLYQEKI